MPDLETIIDALDLKVLTPLKSPPVTVEYACASDLLSNVMATCPGHCLWITVQCHINVVGVASLLDVQAVVLVGGAVPEQAVLKKAREVGVTLLATHDSAFNLCGKLYNLGVRGVKRHELTLKSGGVL